MANFGTTNQYITYSVNSSEIQIDTANNRSLVRVWIDVWRTNSGYTTYGSGTVYARINGTQYSAAITSDQKITSTAIRLGTWDVWVTHDSNGAKSISITGWISHSRFSSSEQGYTHTLTTIPRQASMSSFTCATAYLNGQLTVKYNSKTSYTYYLRLSVPGVKQIYRASLGTKAAGDQTTTYTFTSTELETIYNLYTTTDKVTIGAVIETYNGSTKIGESSEATMILTMPLTVVPSFTSVTAAGVDLFGSLYLQSKSSVKLTVNGAAGIYGSTIKSYSIKGDTFSYSGTDNIYTTTVLEHSGDITFTATVTDSRGRTASKTVKITVTPYSSPTLKIDAYRCNSSGVADNTKGTYIAVVVTFTYAAVTGNSITSKSLKINNVSKSTAFASGTKYVFGTYSLSAGHTITVSITDAVGTTVGPISAEIGVGIVIVDYTKNGIAFGRMLDAENEVQMGWTLDLFNGLKVNGQEAVLFTIVEDEDY